MATALALDLLAWLDAEPRTYDDAIERWRSHCPRLTIWEDALADGLIRIRRIPEQRAVVVVTPLGRAALRSGERGVAQPG
jgi:hypothetical protein